MKKNIAVIGGDKRMVILANILAKENNVITFGQELEKHIKEVAQANSLIEALEQSETIIGPIPFSKDGEKIYTEYSKNIILIKEVMQRCKGKVIVTGAISKEICAMAKENNVECIDLMQNESLTVLNTIATAEGAIEAVMRRTQRTIHGSKVLVLGYGRVAKVVAQKFAALLADVTCAARKQEAFAWMEVDGFKKININELGENLKEYDIIINTPPTLILDKERLKYLKKDCLVIDLASKPGGVDVDAAKELGINFEWALALPGKVAPITAAEHIKRTIECDDFGDSPQNHHIDNSKGGEQ